MGPVARYLGPWVARAAAVAGPGAGRRGRAGRRRRRRRAQGRGPRVRPHRAELVAHGLGLGRDVPRHRQARRRQRCAHPARAAARLGGQPARAARRRCSTKLEARPGGVQRRAAAPRSRWPTSSCWPAPRRSRRPPRTPVIDVTVPFHAGSHRRHPGADRRRLVRASSSPAPTASATTCAPARSCQPETLLVDRAYMLGLSAPRDDRRSSAACARSAPTSAASQHGVLTDRPGVLTNDFFVNLLAPGTRVEGVGVGRRTSTRSATSRPAT